MASQDTSLALDPARLWERLRQEAGLSGEPGEAPVEAHALVSAVTGSLSPDDVSACEDAGAALAEEPGALDQRLDDLQRWSDLLATILDESLASARERSLATQQALRQTSIEIARALVRGHEHASDGIQRPGSSDSRLQTLQRVNSVAN